MALNSDLELLTVWVMQLVYQESWTLQQSYSKADNLTTPTLKKYIYSGESQINKCHKIPVFKHTVVGGKTLMYHIFHLGLSLNTVWIQTVHPDDHTQTWYTDESSSPGVAIIVHYSHGWGRWWRWKYTGVGGVSMLVTKRAPYWPQMRSSCWLWKNECTIYLSYSSVTQKTV